MPHRAEVPRLRSKAQGQFSVIKKPDVMFRSIQIKDYTVSHFLLFSSIAYSAGVFFAFIMQRENGQRVRGIIPFLIGIFLASVAYSASATAQYGSAAILFILFYAIAVPFSIFGIGAFLTSMVSFLPSNILGYCFKVGLIAMPVVFAAVAQHESNQRRDVRQQQAADQRSLFQMSEVEGTLSGMSVVLPGSPQIDLYHDCNNMVPRSRRTCRTFFPTAGWLRVEDGVTTSVPFKQVFINPTDTATATWCDQRPDMENRVWCSEILDYQIRLTETPGHALDESWSEFLNAPDDLKIWCQEDWQGSICQSLYIVAPDVFARGWFRNVDPNQIVSIAVDLQRVSGLIWQDISRKP